MRALCEALGFQLQLDGCKHEVITTANIAALKRPCVCFVVLLMLDLKYWGVRMKYICFWTHPLGACKFATLDNLWGWNAGKGDSLWTPGVSILCRLFLQCKTFLLSLPSVGMCKGLLWHSNHLELQVYPSWDSLLWCYPAAHITELFNLNCLSSEVWWTWMTAMLCCPRWRWVSWRWESRGRYYLQLLSMPPHTGVSSLLQSTRSCVPHRW